MRMSKACFMLAILVLIALGLWETPTVQADGVSEDATRAKLEALPPQGEVPGYQSATLTARLYDSDREAVSGVPVTFYVVSTVFGERLMRAGEALTDITGTASLVYKPTWVGDHTVVARFNGNDSYVPVQTSFHFSVAGPVNVHEDAPFGLESIREWSPLGAGLVVLAVWGVLGLVVKRMLLDIPAGVAAAEPVAVAAPIPVPEPVRSPRRGVALVLATALLLVALPGAWLLTRKDEGDGLLSTESARFGDQYGSELLNLDRPRENAFPVTLVRSIPTMITDANGQITHNSADLPADVAVIGDRVFILDTNNGRILRVTSDGRLVSILDSDPSAGISLAGARAMTAHGGQLYVANYLGGEIVVVDPTGHFERVIKPQVPEAQEQLRPAGIAVTPRGEIWLSDSENHRVLLLSNEGEFLGVTGEGVRSSGEYGFDTPGGLALDQQGNLRVADTANHEVKTYSPMGVFLMAVGGDRLVEPQAVVVDEKGNTWVSDEKLASVLAFGPDGRYQGSIGGQSAPDNDSRSWLQSPYGLKVEGGEIYVMDRLAGLFVFQLGRGPAP